MIYELKRICSVTKLLRNTDRTQLYNRLHVTLFLHISWRFVLNWHKKGLWFSKLIFTINQSSIFLREYNFLKSNELCMGLKRRDAWLKIAFLHTQKEKKCKWLSKRIVFSEFATKEFASTNRPCTKVGQLTAYINWIYTK